MIFIIFLKKYVYFIYLKGIYYFYRLNLKKKKNLQLNLNKTVFFLLFFYWLWKAIALDSVAWFNEANGGGLHTTWWSCFGTLQLLEKKETRVQKSVVSMWPPNKWTSLDKIELWKVESFCWLVECRQLWWIPFRRFFSPCL